MNRNRGSLSEIQAERESGGGGRVVRRKGLSSGRWKRGGGVVNDEEEMAEAGEVEKERGVMPEDDEVRAGAGRWRRKLISAVTVTKTSAGVLALEQCPYADCA